MTLVSSLITDAFREGNILPLGRVPTDAQAAEALRLFNQNNISLYGSDAGENTNDWPLGIFGYENPNPGPDYAAPDVCHPPLNKRMVATNTAARTVYFSPFPQDGSRMEIIDPFGRLAGFPVTVNGNGRTIEGGASVVLNLANTSRSWCFRADKGDWVKVNSLALTDENPWPVDYDIFFIVGLAMRLNPRYGREMDAQTATAFKSARQQFIARYLQSLPLEVDDSLSWPFMSRQSFGRARSFSSNAAFNRGYYGG